MSAEDLKNETQPPVTRFRLGPRYGLEFHYPCTAENCPMHLRQMHVAGATATWCHAHLERHGHLIVVDGPGTDDFQAVYHLPVASRAGLREFLSRLLPEHYLPDSPLLPSVYLDRMVRELAPGLPEVMTLHEFSIYQEESWHLYRLLTEFFWTGPFGG